MTTEEFKRKHIIIEAYSDTAWQYYMQFVQNEEK